MSLASKRYYFLNGTLHKQLRFNKHQDTIVAYDFGDNKTKNYIASDVVRKKEPAFNAYAVGVICNRVRRVIRQWKARGDIPQPVAVRSFTNPDHVVDIFWNTDQAWECWRIFSEVHVGRPRSDNQITPKTPSLQEARMHIEGGKVLYYEDENGEFQPTWTALE